MTLVAQLVESQPVRKKILDTLDVLEGEAVTTLRINLTTRVRYIRHFPYESGQELRIKITPFDISHDNADAFFERETLVPFDHEDLPLNEVVYEGDIEGGPYLTLFFSHCVDFWVEQGRDSRSIVVYIDEVAPEVPEQLDTESAGE
ncbi:MAG: hypothetical protein ABFS24_12495 [Pseudomonadota bacterium]